jgi:uncharacterized tellurite resistance protein B-like protein
VALPEFIAKERLAWQPDEKGRHRFYADAAVGQVDVAEVIPGGGPDEPDRVRVLVKWSGHRELERVPGLFTPQYERSRFIQQEYTLVRKRGVTSVQGAALTSLHCPGCGAPQVAESDGECRYCGLKQNDGSISWVLESVAGFNGFAYAAVDSFPAAGQTRVVQVSPKEQEMLIQCVAAIMLADGVIDPKEEKQLHKMAARHNIESSRLYELIHEVQNSEQIQLPMVEDWETRNALLKALVQMCLADGNVSASERSTLKAMAGHMGYTDVDIDTIIAKERTNLYLASRAAIKASKKN